MLFFISLFFVVVVIGCGGGSGGGRGAGGRGLFSSQVRMLSEENVIRLKCQGKASLEMEAKTVEVFSPYEKC